MNGQDFDMKFIFAFLLGLCFASSEDHEKYKYYNGYGQSVRSLQEAREIAHKTALDLAIRENFGFMIQLESQLYENSGQVLSTKLDRVKAPLAMIEGFELVEEKIDSDDGNYQVKAKFRYDRQAIERERKRQQVNPAGIQKWNESGVLKPGSFTLSVTTEPEGALVYVNDSLYGKTPLIVRENFGVGINELKITHPHSEDLETTFGSSLGGEGKLHFNLKPAFGSLKLICPRGGEVFWGETKVGNCMNSYRVPAGREFSLTIKHPEYFEQTIGPIVLSGGETKSIDIRLTPIAEIKAPAEPRASFISEAASTFPDAFSGWSLDEIHKPYASIVLSNFDSPVSQYGLGGLLTSGQFGATFHRYFGISYSFGNPSDSYIDEAPEFQPSKMSLRYTTIWLLNSVREKTRYGSSVFQVGFSVGELNIDYKRFGLGRSDKFDMTGLNINWLAQHENFQFSLGAGLRNLKGNSLFLTPRSSYFVEIGYGLCLD